MTHYVLVEYRVQRSNSIFIQLHHVQAHGYKWYLHGEIIKDQIHLR